MSKVIALAIILFLVSVLVFLVFAKPEKSQQMATEPYVTLIATMICECVTVEEAECEPTATPVCNVAEPTSTPTTTAECRQLSIATPTYQPTRRRPGPDETAAPDPTATAIHQPTGVPLPTLSPTVRPTKECKPGWGHGDKNHCHDGPPGWNKHHDN
jgi:hypothetical protein